MFLLRNLEHFSGGYNKNFGPSLVAPANSTQYVEGFMKFWADPTFKFKGIEEDLVTSRNQGGSNVNEEPPFCFHLPLTFDIPTQQPTGKVTWGERYGKLVEG